MSATFFLFANIFPVAPSQQWTASSARLVVRCTHPHSIYPHVSPVAGGDALSSDVQLWACVCTCIWMGGGASRRRWTYWLRCGWTELLRRLAKPVEIKPWGVAASGLAPQLPRPFGSYAVTVPLAAPSSSRPHLFLNKAQATKNPRDAAAACRHRSHCSAALSLLWPGWTRPSDVCCRLPDRLRCPYYTTCPTPAFSQNAMLKVKNIPVGYRQQHLCPHPCPLHSTPVA